MKNRKNEKTRKNKALKILGVMTGTSCDGIDLACIDIDQLGWSPLWSSSAPYPASLRKRVLEFQIPASSHTSQSWLELHRDLGRWYASAIQKSISKHRELPDVVANHGQTVAHFPKDGTTLQLGDGSRIATATGLTVVNHFREGDMAAGGQGAPLVPLFHQMIAQMLPERINSKSGVAIHNMGGISNLSYFGPNGKVLAFDTGPANIWIDAAVEQATQGKQRFDSEGRLAQQGVSDTKAVARVLKHPFFSKLPPKSTGRDQFPFEYFKSKTRSHGNDLVATATAVTVESIVQAYKRWILKAGFPLQKIYICGGGAKNLTLLKGIEEGLKEFRSIKVSTLAEVGLDVQTIEPLAFAFFGYLSLLGNPLGGTWTGAKSFGPPGQIIPGQNWTEILRKIQL
ncbi:MAG: anhydro-N-acetylmuramic acid kinase [Bdellovibrionia bacterium]